MNEIPPAQRGTTPTDSLTDSIVLSGSTAVRSALRATGKDQQEETRHHLLHHLFPLTPLSIPSHMPKPTMPLLFLIRIIHSIMSIQV